MPGTVYLIPTVLHSDEQALQAIPLYITDAIKQCTVFFAENEKTARRFFKKIWRDIVIDNYAWHQIHKAEEEAKNTFANYLQQDKTIGIISEAGCPGIADPGQALIETAQKMNAIVRPLVGPSSVLLAMMASGMNGQCFQFNGYLPIDTVERRKKIKELEGDSAKKKCTQIFIETPYRNMVMLNDILSNCRNETMLCVAADITGSGERITAKTIAAWKKDSLPELHKRLVIFLLHAG